MDQLTSTTLPPPSELAATLAPAVAGGHLRLWSHADDAQLLFEQIGADGALAHPEEGDFVQLVTQNGGENKIDWFQRRALTYEPTFDPATGDVTATATVTITNTAPTSGVSSYIIGEEGGPTAPGENRVHVTLVTPHRLVRALDETGAPLPVNVGREQGFTMITAVLRIPSWRRRDRPLRAGGQGGAHARQATSSRSDTSRPSHPTTSGCRSRRPRAGPWWTRPMGWPPARRTDPPTFVRVLAR